MRSVKPLPLVMASGIPVGMLPQRFFRFTERFTLAARTAVTFFFATFLFFFETPRFFDEGRAGFAPVLAAATFCIPGAG